MKQIILILVGVAVLYFVFFTTFTTKSEVVMPEIKKTSEYQRPVREGNCWRQWDTGGNSFLVCH